MPVKPQPFKYKCPKCGYSKIVRIKSDNIGFEDLINMDPTCPKCGTQMEKKTLNILDKLLG